MYSSAQDQQFMYSPAQDPQWYQPQHYLKQRYSSENTVCLPTVCPQLFDDAPQSPPSRPLSISIKPPALPMKRSASPPLSPTDSDDSTMQLPKKRAVGERISTKDFVPPDVSGLSKREARLVKNRAAAFLSRQRKREEFETMEIRVVELERENARLLALTGQTTQCATSTDPSDPISEIDSLKSQLEALKQREAALSAQLALQAQTRVKEESYEDSSYLLEELPRPSSASSSSSSNSNQSQSKSAASLGLMVLLCALPSLLAVPSGTSAALPATFALPTALPSSPSSAPLDFSSFGLSDGTYDWSQTTATVIDAPSPSSSVPATRRLQFSNLPTPGGDSLDLSFDASPSADGKIRVRIHNAPLSSANSVGNSRSVSPGLTRYSPLTAASVKSEDGPLDQSMEMWDQSVPGLSYSDSSSSAGGLSPNQSPNDPFLGVGSTSPSTEFAYSAFNYPHQSMYPQYSTQYDSLAGALDYKFSQDSAKQRRVRIALKTMPEGDGSGREGGEWEVEFC